MFQQVNNSGADQTVIADVYAGLCLCCSHKTSDMAHIVLC